MHIMPTWARDAVVLGADAPLPIDRPFTSREAERLGVAVSYNESLVALLKGRELHARRRREQPDLDYEAWEARVAAGGE